MTQLDIWHKRIDTLLHRCLRSHIHCALFTNVRRWKQPKCPSPGEQIMKMWFIYIIGHIIISFIKKNVIMKFSGKTETRKYYSGCCISDLESLCHMFALIYGSQIQIFRCDYITWSNHKNKESRKQPCGAGGSRDWNNRI